MTDSRIGLRRLASSAGIYAAAGLAQQGAGFLLIPLYTRLIEPSAYGMLEIFNAFSSVGFACLTMGLSSAINKCYHRDCQSDSEQAAVLTTAVLLDLPVLLAAAALALAFGAPISRWLTGTETAEPLLRLVIVSGLCYGIVTLLLAGLRAQERAAAFSIVTLVQFGTALGLNLVLVAGYRLGLRGVLWGNLLSNALAVPLALVVARRGNAFTFKRNLVGPLLRFGLLLVPVMLAAWTMDLSDRYLLRLYRSLDEVAVYGVGYKFGMMLQVAIVWPFQLAWPAFSFAISNRPGHKVTYARTLTYLTVVLAFMVLVLSLLAPVAMPIVVGSAYRDAFRVIPLVAMAYAFNGIQYCVSPGIHVAGRTKYLTGLAAAAAVLNLVLNLVLIPLFGMMGAAWSTVLAFFFLAASTTAVGQRFYPVAYEYGRLAKVCVASVLVYVAAISIGPGAPTLGAACHVGALLLGFPVALLAMGFLDEEERIALGGLFRRYVPRFG